MQHEGESTLKAAIEDLVTERDTWSHVDEGRHLDSVRIEATAGRNHVWGTTAGIEKVVFSYYPDELTFTAREIEGLTIAQARKLHYDRDIAWLQS